MQGHGEGAGNRGRRHHQQVGAPAPFHQRAPLGDPEAVLLVHDRKPEVPEPGAFLDERMGADDELGPAARYRPQGVAALPGAEPRGEQHDADLVRLQQSADGGEMLLREDLGRGHERRLRPVMDDDEGRDDRHDRLSRTHVALEEPPHGERRAELLRNRGERGALGAGEAERQHLPHQVAERVVHGEGVSAGPPDPVLAAAQLEPEGKDEELFQDEPLVAGRTFPVEFRERGAVRREVHFFERLPPGRQPHPRHQFLGEIAGPHRVAAVQQPMQDGAEESRGERPDPLVDRHDTAGVRAGRGRRIRGRRIRGNALGRRRGNAGIRKRRVANPGTCRPGARGIGVTVLRHEFVTRIREFGHPSGDRTADFPEQEHPLPRSQDPLEVHLVEPGRLDRAARVVAAQLDDLQVPPPRRPDAERSDEHFRRRGFAVDQLGGPAVLAPILVAERQPQQEVRSPQHPCFGERGGAPGPDPRKETDLGIRGDSGQGRLFRTSDQGVAGWRRISPDLTSNRSILCGSGKGVPSRLGRLPSGSWAVKAPENASDTASAMTRGGSSIPEMVPRTTVAAAEPPMSRNRRTSSIGWGGLPAGGASGPSAAASLETSMRPLRCTSSGRSRAWTPVRPARSVKIAVSCAEASSALTSASDRTTGSGAPEMIPKILSHAPLSTGSGGGAGACWPGEAAPRSGAAARNSKRGRTGQGDSRQRAAVDR